jgi:hypothetical protein
MSYLHPHDDERCGKGRTAKEEQGNVIHYRRPCGCGNRRCAGLFYVTEPTFRVLPRVGAR